MKYFYKYAVDSIGDRYNGIIEFEEMLRSQEV